MLEPQQVGRRFTLWPLHITLLPWFSAPDATTVEHVCQETVHGLHTFTVHVGERGYYGQRNLPVKHIMHSPELNDLHLKLLNAIEHQSWDIKGRYTGPHFRPHVTQKQGKDAGGEITVNSLYIVEKLGQGYREITSKVELTHE